MSNGAQLHVYCSTTCTCSAPVREVSLGSLVCQISCKEGWRIIWCFLASCHQRELKMVLVLVKSTICGSFADVQTSTVHNESVILLPVSAGRLFNTNL